LIPQAPERLLPAIRQLFDFCTIRFDLCIFSIIAPPYLCVQNNQKTNTMDKKVWYVSGASKGLGLALTHKLLTQGYRVAATSRLLAALVEATGGNTIENFLPLEVDLADERSIADSIRTTWEAFGRIDVVVNNARLGGAAHTVIPQAMPYLRRQGQGYIIDMGGDIMGEMRSSGIRRTTVALGAFRIQFLKNEIQASNAMYVSIDGRQPGDPQKAASALIRLPAMPEPPALLVLDSDAYRTATAKTMELEEQLDRGPRLLCRVAR
jgi:hypothetical protein